MSSPHVPRFSTLGQWLAWQETLHPERIDLGLDRVAQVASRLGSLQPGAAVITVGGTNGKGSSVAMLEAILGAAGYRVGAFTSPHLLRYNERIRIDGQDAGDAILCAAFHRIDQARRETSLTYFEFNALAAMDIFTRMEVDIALLEVGLGGRLDAVNIVDADIALITGVDIDHCQWLGPDRDAIGREKAGICRGGRPVVCSDPAPPAGLRQRAAEIGARWICAGEEFGFEVENDAWTWWGPGRMRRTLPRPALHGLHQLQNASGVLMALETFRERFPVPLPAIEKGLRSVRLAGRYQMMNGVVEQVFDVAHNVQSARALAENLRTCRNGGRTLLVLGMLNDKDVHGFTTALAPHIDAWYLAGLDGSRGLTAQELARRVVTRDEDIAVLCFSNVEAAYAAARGAARTDDRIVVCGSFHTVAQAVSAGL
jgi:dihydrofolate synthase/folylpolyglutamate synthase